ncbi:MAG: hypothetical protein QOJ19_4367 [Acidimicrobiia bacterium]|jgi:hypothetical protein|nr:hypothetical protein [Acidimicrobiia bacterium]
MTSVTVTDTFDAPIERVWPLVADFAGLGKYVRSLQNCVADGEGIGMDRIIGTGDAQIVERLTWLDSDRHALSYTIVSGETPMRRYVSTVELTPQGQQTGITWTGHFEPNGVGEDEAKKVPQGIYNALIKGYKRALAG